ncbi:MAG: prepilin peptidase [Lachnospiraceae bacterium]|nr:prepilin peptidase [Lachnospiraceae bacterium]
MKLQIASMIYLLMLSISDVKKKELPLWLVVTGMILSVLWMGSALFRGERTMIDVFFGSVPGLILLMLAASVGCNGWGDGIVLLQWNFLLGTEMTVMSFGISLIFSGCAALFLLCSGKKKGNQTIPYIPFLLLGSIGAYALKYYF